MAKIPDLRENIAPADEIIDAAKQGDLVLFVGAGASMMLGLPSWSGLAFAALDDLRKAGFINYSELSQLSVLDAKKQLSIATLIAEENGYAIDFKSKLTEKNKKDGIYNSINETGCQCVTTNYDELLEPRFNISEDGSTTFKKTNRVADREKIFCNLLNEPGTVIHLHGSINDPKTMVVTTKDYLEHYDNKNIQVFLGELFEKKTVLFIGYSLEEAEILEHILRRGAVKSSKERKRFMLQGFFLSEQPLYENLFNYYEKSFGVHLLGFIRDHDNYKCLEDIIKSWAPKIKVKAAPLATDMDFMDEVLGND